MIIIQHIKITGIDASIGFYDILKPTDSPLFTGLGLIAGGQGDVVFKGPNEGLTSLFKVFVP